MKPQAHKIIQNAYVVSDVDEAVARCHRLWGLGPFFVRRNFVLEDVTYRGAPSALEISVAYVQAGGIMVELVTQLNDAPSAFRDVYQPGQEGFHHVAVAMDDHGKQVAHYRDLGFEVVTELSTPEGRGASYIDTRSAIGHMVEVYKVNDSLHELYARVRQAAHDWDGKNLTIDL